MQYSQFGDAIHNILAISWVSFAKDSFAKEPYKTDYVLQTRPTNLRSLLIIATPYMYINVYRFVSTHTYTILKKKKSVIELALHAV